RRRFAGWAMRHDPVRAWMWTRADVDAGALGEAETHEILAFFDRVAADPLDTAPKPAGCAR
ncbi:MAG: hypothetical protein AAFV86_17820, partial [Pseudomonadota bacterium]